MVPHERVVAPGHETTFPRNADTVVDEYHKSAIYPRTMQEAQTYPTTQEAADNTAVFREMVAREKHKGVRASSPVTADFLTQVKAATTRQYQILWGDKATLFMKQGATVIQALLGGSLFYSAPDNSAGLFLKGGALFFSILYNALLALSEVTDSFTGRPILAKHRSFALYNPAAVVIGQVVADLPLLLFQVSQFGLILYFMVGLKMTAGAFFTYLAINYTTALSMTSFFRVVGAAFSTFDAATKVSGLSIVALFVYMGYMIIKPEMHPWFSWIFWINPVAYAFDALLSNEFHGQIIACVGPYLIPNGQGYAEGQGGQACAGVGGAPPGATSVTGEQYLKHLSFSHGHIWRNFGIICAWWVLFVGLTIFFTNGWKQVGEGGRSLLIPREQHHKTKHLFQSLNNEEQVQPAEKTQANPGFDSDRKLDNELIRNRSIFTWKNLSYTVKTSDGDRVLLDNVQDYVKPGMLGALMGASGAGKTTLLDVLAQRKTEGTIHGSVLVDGRPIPVSFQRSAGYVEQLDVHEPLATVREALEFSALLRQPRDTPTEEKLRYVDTIVDLLELNHLQHTVVGSPGNGLSVEQRKRLTIGVELVAKPSILIFLDEPTSGLDGQAAYNTIRFLRKLAAAGQAILVTIHQPSAQLFAQFDTLLLLAKGGRTVYFGGIGDNASTIKSYFGRHGAPCPSEANPAENMIDVISGNGASSHKQDWSKIWLESPEHEHLSKELDHMVESALSRPSGVAMHVSLALLNGFTFWMIGDSLTDLQQNLFTVFNFIFIAPGIISQLQPLFIDRRDIYETREKKSKMYHWAPFVAGLIVSEFPYLLMCALLYYVCWYFTAGLPSGPGHAGSVFFVVVMYEFLYTGIGQMIAAYTPNAVFAALVNPLVITTLVSFCGVMVPYSQIEPFWKYWIYYIDPFNYLMSSLLVFTTWDKPVHCRKDELAIFDPPSNQTCGDYLSVYKKGMGIATNLLNPDDTSSCRVCQYTQGGDFLQTLNMKEEWHGWRNAVSDTESTASLPKWRAVDGGKVRNYRDATTATAFGHIGVASPSVSGPSSSVQDHAAREALQDPILHLSHLEARQLARAATPTTLPTRKPHEIEYMRHEGVFTKLPDDVCDELIGCYFQHVHFFLPILDVPTVLNEYWSRGSQGINPLLLWSMFLASANFIGGETLEKAGFSSRKAMKTAMYYRAKCLFYLDRGTDILDLIRSVMLLAFWHSDPQDYTGAWYWIGIAISLAQAINLHRDDAANTERKRLVKVSEPMARRIWWSLVVGDRWIAAANGRPMRLRSDSHDLARPTREDVLWELERINPEARSEFILENESSLAALWLRMVRVSDALGDVLQLHHRVKGPEPSMEKVNRLLYELDEVEFAYSPSSDDDDVHVHTVQVEMLYQATIAILCRPYVLDATKSSAADANPKLKQSLIRRGREAASSTNDLVEQLIEMNAIEYMKPIIITAMVPATQIHLADCRSESTLTRSQGRNKLQLCVSVFAELRSTYWSADVMYRLFKRAQDLAAGEILTQPSPRETPRRPETLPGERQRAAQRMRNVHLMASTLVSAAAAAALPPIVPMTPVSTGTVSQFGDMDQLLSPEFALSEHLFTGLLPNYPIGNYT
ncbi:hypothetical protein MY10362_005152 [Beauveria mimosiformis]